MLEAFVRQQFLAKSVNFCSDQNIVLVCHMINCFVLIENCYQLQDSDGLSIVFIQTILGGYLGLIQGILAFQETGKFMKSVPDHYGLCIPKITNVVVYPGTPAVPSRERYRKFMGVSTTVWPPQ